MRNLFAILLFSCQFAVAQFVPASPPIADLDDTRFSAVFEDLSTPAIGSSHLISAPPVTGYLNEYPTYSVELLQVQWRAGDPIDLYVMRPKGIAKPPVIVYLYGYPADTDRFKDPNFQQEVTRGGFAAVGFVSALTGHRYHDRPMRQWFLSELQESLTKSAHDVQMVLNYLASRGDLDMNRVGMFAQGSGASIAILTSAVDARIKALDALDPWGDWRDWLPLSPFVPEEERAEYVTPEFLHKLADLDPLDSLRKLRSKSFRLQDAAFDPITPKIAKEKFRTTVPANGTILLFHTREEFNAIVREHKEMEWIHRTLH